jgi:hypothetical protein
MRKAAADDPLAAGAMTATRQYRARLSRAARWRLPPDAVSVAWPTKWANPYWPAGTPLRYLSPTTYENTITTPSEQVA